MMDLGEAGAEPGAPPLDSLPPPPPPPEVDLEETQSEARPSSIERNAPLDNGAGSNRAQRPLQIVRLFAPEAVQNNSDNVTIGKFLSFFH